MEKRIEKRIQNAECGFRTSELFIIIKAMQDEPERYLEADWEIAGQLRNGKIAVRKP